MENLTTRQLQIECSKALATISCSNGSLSKYNKLAHHNSIKWYQAVINDYINQWGDIPSKIGPAKDIKMVLDV